MRLIISSGLLSLIFCGSSSFASTKTFMVCENQAASVSYKYSAIGYGYELDIRAAWTIDGEVFLEQSADLSEELMAHGIFSSTDEEAGSPSPDLAYRTKVKVISYLGKVLFEGPLLCMQTSDRDSERYSSF